ncbi:UNVERIFIED_ORG: hypothetical protein GGI57_005260 [Rhizobium aethiopicum]
MPRLRRDSLPLNQSDGGYIFEQRSGVISVSRHPDQGHRGANLVYREAPVAPTYLRDSPIVEIRR